MLTTAILALFAAPISGLVTPAASAVSIDPADRFAADITARAGAGHRLRRLSVDRQEDAMILSAVLAGDGEATRFELRYSRDGQHVVDYRATAVSPPAEARVYPVEDQLLAALAAASPGPLYDEGMVFGLEQPGGVVYLDLAAYYVVDRRYAGAGADAALAAILVATVESGGELIEMTAGEDGFGRHVDLVFDGDDRLTVHVGTDDAGRVAVVEARRSPPSDYVYQRYLYNRELRVTLLAGRAVHTLTLESRPDGGARLIGLTRGGDRLVIDQADFEIEEMEAGC